MSSDRYAYLLNLADNYGIDEEIVLSMAEILGESEDHDGLVSFCEDYTDY
jgi:hypothetical protein